MFDFANLLFAGPCNRACPFCIGKALPPELNRSNLKAFPPAGLEQLIQVVNGHQIPEVVFTGTTSDPQLYRYEGELLDLLRARLHPRVRFSIHTNGARALERLEIFNRYDRACLSIPSFDPRVYEAMMGSRAVPDVAEILRRATLPVKISAVLTEHNAPGIQAFIEQCQALGVRRLVIRRLFGDTRRWDVLPAQKPVRLFRQNPVFDFRGMEVTWWDFDAATSRSVNLFADGTLGTEYLLMKTAALVRPAREARGP
ncbi:MAG: radical SAM protein [Polyangiaceae bacterium]|nr:radical SAM protein [Polyangiaceae bacterium]